MQSIKEKQDTDLMSLDIEHLRGWVGRTEAMDDLATLAPLRGLTATLDRDDPPRVGDAIPPCWHWLYFLPMHRQSGIGPDGHPRRGGFLPPVPLPRRMWAGSQIEFRAPLLAGQSLSRLSRIDDVRVKEGRSGPLVFVNVQHEIRGDGDLAIVERQWEKHGTLADTLPSDEEGYGNYWNSRLAAFKAAVATEAREILTAEQFENLKTTLAARGK